MHEWIRVIMLALRFNDFEMYTDVIRNGCLACLIYVFAHNALSGIAKGLRDDRARAASIHTPTPSFYI